MVAVVEGASMGLLIESAEVERMARGAARRRGVSVTEALRQLLVEEEARILARAAEIAEKLCDLHDIQARIAALPNVSDMTDDEILGYDENGIPSPSGNFALTDVKVADW
jgi:antitoxin VapB